MALAHSTEAEQFHEGTKPTVRAPRKPIEAESVIMPDPALIRFCSHDMEELLPSGD
jgi:hypothetical protein